MTKVAAALLFSVCAAGCARPETVVHVSAPETARWQVFDADGDPICFLPCHVELDDHDQVTIARVDGRSSFVVRQRDLGPGAFSASVRIKKSRARGALAARVFGAALSGAGSAMLESDEEDLKVAGIVLSGAGAAASAIGEHERRESEELWVERTKAP